MKALWQVVEVESPAFMYQSPPLTKVSACTLAGLEAVLVQLELGRTGCYITGQGQDDDVPFLVVQHTDDVLQTWQTHVTFPEMKGYNVWSATVYTDHVKLAFMKDKP
jgi:hypothetical protein